MGCDTRNKTILKWAGVAIFVTIFLGCGDKSTDDGSVSDAPYIIKLNPTGGTVTPESITVTPNPPYNWVVVSFPTPARNGYTFTGWYTEEAGGNEVLGPRVSFRNDVTLYAHWTLAHYRITFAAHGGTVTPAYGTTGDGWKLASLPEPTRDAYHDFGGWYTALIDGTGEKIDTNHVYTANATIYAHWIYTGVHHTITFNANGGAVDPATEETDTGGKLQDLPTPTRNGYAFNGWFTAATGGTAVTTNTVFSNATTIYAQWTAITSKMYTVMFDAHGGTVTPASGITGEDGKLASLPTPTRDGYTFNGWFTESAAVTASTVFTANATIHAQWTIIHYKITFNPTGGTVTPTTATTSSHWELADLPTPTRDGYTFTGWYTEETGGTHVMPNSTPLIGNLTIYAHWVANPPSLVDSRDGKVYRDVAIGEQIWMAENLNYATVSSVCYDNDPANCAKYGRLYNWEEAMTACPVGWHLPSADEWTELTDFIGGPGGAGNKLKSTTGWLERAGLYNYNGTDEYGFSALPGGVGDPNGSFRYGHDQSRWWSATKLDDSDAWGMYLHGGISNVEISRYDKSYLYSVRCVKD